MSNWNVLTTSAPSITLPAPGDGDYEIQVVAIDAFGNRSDVVIGERSVASGVVGQLVEGERIESVGQVGTNRLGNGRLQITWSPSKTQGLLVAIRHSSQKDAIWGTANPLLGTRLWPSADGKAEVPLLEGTYLLRHLAPNGESSAGITRQWVPDEGEPLMEVASVITESFLFAGSKVNCMNDSLNNGLTLSRLLWDDLPSLSSLPLPIDSYGARTVDTRLWDDLPDDLSSLLNPIDAYGVDSRLGTYYFAQELTFSVAKTVELQRVILSRCIYRETRWDLFQGLVDEIPSMESLPEAGYVQLEYRARSSAGDSWSEWQGLTRSQAYGQSFQFRAQINGGDINQDVLVSKLQVRAYVPRANLVSTENQAILNLSVTPGQTVTGTVALSTRCILLTIASNSALWLRLYSSQQAMSLDADRISSTAPELAAGVIADPIFAAAGTIQLDPVLHAMNRESSRTSAFPFRVTNYGASNSLQLVFTYYPL